MSAVSVVIPCYNDGVYLKDAIASVRQQTYPDLEIIVVDDGSTDTFTRQVFEELKKEGVKVLHKKNGHLSSARNYGIAAASGEIIVTLDADDIFKPTFIEKGVHILNNAPGVGVVTCYVRSFGLKSGLWRPLGGDIHNLLFRQECCASAMFRRSCWKDAGGYDEAMKHGYEDWEFWIRVTAAGWRISVIPETLFYYRVSEKSMFLNVAEPRREELIDYIVEKHRNLYLRHLKEGVANRRIMDMSSKNLWMLLVKNVYQNFRQSFRTS